MLWKKIVIFTIIGLLALFALLYAAPNLLRIPGNDYSIFQYFGQGIINGKLPYRDLYDHKPPAIFYINALGLALSNGSRWGIWIIEVLSLFAAGTLSFAFLSRHFGKFPSFIATGLLFLNITYFHDGGNLTEEYALPFQFASLYLLSLWQQRDKKRWLGIGIGVMLAVATTFKQSLGALGVSIGLYMLLITIKNKGWRKLTDLLWPLLGFGVVWAVWFGYFFSQGILKEFWEGAFAYNFALSNISTDQRILALINILLRLFKTSTFYSLSILSWIALIVFFTLSEKQIRLLISQKWLGYVGTFVGLISVYNGIFRRGLTLYEVTQINIRQMFLIIIGIIIIALSVIWIFTPFRTKLSDFIDRRQIDRTPSLTLPIFIALIDFPIQILMVSLSGNNFGHYFLALLPAISILVAFIVWYIQSTAQTHGLKTMAYTWIVLLSLPIAILGGIETAGKIHVSEDNYYLNLKNYVIENTKPTDSIFVWGNLATVYTTSDRISPSRFFFTDPFFVKGYSNRYHSDIFLSELKANPPKLILYPQKYWQPLIYLNDPNECYRLTDMEYVKQMIVEQYQTSKMFIPDGMNDIYSWICENYSAEVIVLPTIDKHEILALNYTPNRSNR